jgi:fatty-acid peroxygenase
MTKDLPREGLDSTLALLRDPYGFIFSRCRKHGSNLFEARILLQPTICMTGRECAELFYDNDRFRRAGALPGRIQKTLLGRGGVQGLDDAEHRHRKAMFMSLMTPDAIRSLAALSTEHWRRHLQGWTVRGEITVYPAMQALLCQTVCAWAGVPLAEDEIDQRCRQLTLMFDRAGAVGPAHWQARLARRRGDRWAESLVRATRSGELAPPEGSALQVVSGHRAQDGELLPPRIAAVELLNVLRPTVAVALYVTFAAHALHQYPDCRERIASGEPGGLERFVQEVRRFYPFFPAAGALVRKDFQWRGIQFPEGRRVLLDLHGTNHDPDYWDAPEEFRPDRFLAWDQSPFNFIPQGGGDHYAHHRCAGEWITIELMKVAVRFLMTEMDYVLPAQDLGVNEQRLPAKPRSGVVISKIKARSQSPDAQMSVAGPKNGKKPVGARSSTG